MRRPVLFNIRSTRSRTSSAVSTVVVNSLRPLRATNTRDGSLIQISSTDGSSRYFWIAPYPATALKTSWLVSGGSANAGSG